jgi:hypothetical protein
MARTASQLRDAVVLDAVSLRAAVSSRHSHLGLLPRRPIQGDLQHRVGVAPPAPATAHAVELGGSDGGARRWVFDE